MPRLFNRIETVGYVRGRPITSWRSRPAGFTIKEVRAVDEALVEAFGSKGSMTIATPIEDPLVYGYPKL